ncbi:MAG: hypothetical protein JO340_21535 [Acidobacteriaceae bacterium]|nr:hypothetical protein [Acidobacteriaceae bacterium]
MLHRAQAHLVGGLLTGVGFFGAVLAAHGQEGSVATTPAYKVLYTFTGEGDGSEYNTLLPYDKYVIRDREGNLYGTAPYGGYESGGEFSTCGEYGCGVAYKLDKAGKQTVLHAFTGTPDGMFPVSSLARDDDGNLYGTTTGGGFTGGSCGGFGCGVVFKIDRHGNESVVYTFQGDADGRNPAAGLVRDEWGSLYGTTPDGGEYGSGTVYKLDNDGKETIVYSFTGGTDGGGPFSGLIRDDKGNLYGTTRQGGAPGSCFGEGCGVVYKIDRSGKQAVIYAFQGAPDGAAPTASLIRDEDGNLYGNAGSGGNTGQYCGSFGCGVVYKIDRNGKESVLYTFAGAQDGEIPTGRLFRLDHKLYGVTYYGGEVSDCFGFGCGEVFELNQAGKKRVVYTFTGEADGGVADAGLTGDEEGNIYGSTEFGGDVTGPTGLCGGGCGVVFEVKVRAERHDSDTPPNE